MWGPLPFPLPHSGRPVSRGAPCGQRCSLWAEVHPVSRDAPCGQRCPLVFRQLIICFIGVGETGARLPFITASYNLFPPLMEPGLPALGTGPCSTKPLELLLIISTSRQILCFKWTVCSLRVNLYYTAIHLWSTFYLSSTHLSIPPPIRLPSV